jgi:hypothetical protein
MSDTTPAPRKRITGTIGLKHLKLPVVEVKPPVQAQNRSEARQAPLTPEAKGRAPQAARTAPNTVQAAKPQKVTKQPPSRDPSPPQPTSQATQKREPAALAILRAAYPAVFVEPPALPRSLAVGCGDEIMANLEALGLSKNAVHVALKHWTSRPGYLWELARVGAHRVALDGADAGEVSEADRLQARERLEQRWAKGAQKEAAQ